MYPVDILTPRELSVISLLVEGLSNRVIAERLGISLNTLETHLRRIYRKLHVSNRTQTVRWYFLQTTGVKSEN